MIRSLPIGLSLVGLPLVGGVGVAQQPTFTISASQESVQKGRVFDIDISIATIQPITNVTIAPLVPIGFVVEAVPTPGVRIDDPGSLAYIDSLAAASSLTVLFRTWLPEHRMPPIEGTSDADEESAISYKHPKRFIFNVSYSTVNDDGVAGGSTTIATSVRLTTSMFHYLRAALMGLLLGFIIKLATRHKAEMMVGLDATATFRNKLGRVLGFLFIKQTPALFTTLAIGFTALLVLAKDTIPLNSWDQAFALGVGLAILSDEELLAKIKA